MDKGDYIYIHNIYIYTAVTMTIVKRPMTVGKIMLHLTRPFHYYYYYYYYDYDYHYYYFINLAFCTGRSYTDLYP